MGGGDLNMKKHFHPLTMENLERVWKAEEKKRIEDERIQQLQQELAAERQKEDFEEQAIQTGLKKKKGEKLDWMYQGQQVDKEAYLLGKKIDRNIEIGKEEPKGLSSGHIVVPKTTSLPKANDVLAKLKEDPLFMIKKREEDNRKELLSNPIKLRKMKELIENQTSEARKGKKHKKIKKKRHRSSSSDEESSEEDKHRERKRKIHNHSSSIPNHTKNENKRESKNKRHQISRSDEESSEEDKHRERKRKIHNHSTSNHSKNEYKSESKKKRYQCSSNEESNDEDAYRQKKGHIHNHNNSSTISNHNKHKYKSESKKNQHRSSPDEESSEGEYSHRKRKGVPYNHNTPSGSKSNSLRRENMKHRQSNHHNHSERREDDSTRYSNRGKQKVYHNDRAESRQHDSSSSDEDEDEKLEAQRKAMMSNAKWRQDQRSKNNKNYQVENDLEEKDVKAMLKKTGKSEEKPDFVHKMQKESFSMQGGSVEDRIHRNIHSKQRTNAALSKNFTSR